MSHLYFNVLIVCFQQTHKVKVLLAKHERLQFPKSLDTLKLAFNACFLPHFPKDSFLNGLACFNQPTWQFPDIGQERVLLLNHQ